MFWLVDSIFNSIHFTVSTLCASWRLLVWSAPFLWNFLLLLSFVKLVCKLLLSLHRLCQKAADTKPASSHSAIGDNKETKESNTNVNIVEISRKWEQKEKETHVAQLKWRFNKKVEKSKSYDPPLRVERSFNFDNASISSSETIIQSAIAEWRKKAELRNIKRDTDSETVASGQKYGGRSHHTTFISRTEDEESSDEIELLSSEEDSSINQSPEQRDVSDEELNNNLEDDGENSYIITDEYDSKKNEHDFVKFAESTNMLQVLDIFRNIKENLGLEVHPGTFKNVFYILKEELRQKIPYRYGELFDHLEEKSRSKEYRNNTVAGGKKALVIGCGPCGLRMAMELQFLGAETTLLETRPYFDRNNVIKLWTFVMEDLKSLGAKKLCPQMGIGSVNHISIRILQFVLLKMALLLGASVKVRESFVRVERPQGERGWVIVSEEKTVDGEVKLHEEEYDILVCASGRKVDVPGFQRTALDAKMSIAITANFVNNNTVEEREVCEIPGLSKQYDQEFFKKLEKQHSIRLENIVYYKNLTHYFVMTAKKDSLVKKGVIKEGGEDRESLLRPQNVDREALEKYARQAATFSTKYFSKELPKTPFSTWKGCPDVSIFDFTALYSSFNACRLDEVKGFTLLTTLVGDSLIQPFWPEGTGVGRGFLSVMDSAWLIKQYCERRLDVYELIREREKLYSLLKQTTDSSLKTNYSKWSINPATRYSTTSFPFPNQDRVYQLYSTDRVQREVDETDEGVMVSLRKEKRKFSKSWSGAHIHKHQQAGNRDTLFIAD